ncbi:response regulator transcription factor [Celeribacter halophilus]|uniref:Response regulator receiver domain-containing protein n=1 Tax=Celeribacter halophilus TaxID=576117 RepID=A0A1I3VGZ5_9RHOB|nr:response regulator [Celeribacter halophilus]PZX09536.1 response regulator receiver domain-containing protein [Celeribacter halophilus]SFJ93636.1 Response regulator receiver domain-containing protein [Celeribacter halophilus]
MAEKPRILLVEDEDNIAIAIEVLLGRAGYDLVRVSDGDQALPNIRAQQPDLVVLDVTLPGCSGYEVCQRLRSDPTLSHIPVLMMSARVSQAEQRKGLAMGADAFLTKPFAMDDLKGLVARLIAGGPHEN